MSQARREEGRGKREEKIDAEERSSMILPSFAAAEGADLHNPARRHGGRSDVLGPEKEDRALGCGSRARARFFVMGSRGVNYWLPAVSPDLAGAAATSAPNSIVYFLPAMKTDVSDLVPSPSALVE